MRVLGADVGAGTWVGIVLDDDSEGEQGDSSAEGDVGGLRVEAVTAGTIGELADLAGAAMRGGVVSIVGVDMPIGLPHGQPGAAHRRAEALARARLPGRASSVFATPVREAVHAASYEAANAANRRLTGAGLSRQSYALSRMILQVDSWARSSRHEVIEVHPEVSFAAMATGPGSAPGEPDAVIARKKSWAGAVRRRALLAAVGIELPDELGRAGRVGAVDDVLDAAAVAWTALRRARGLAHSLPHPPEDVGDGWPAAIWV